jgi:hypothetical protein
MHVICASDVTISVPVGTRSGCYHADRLEHVLEQTQATQRLSRMEHTKKAYAVLGATGNCGLVLLQQLLARKDVKINAYCRSRTKLCRLLPEITADKRVEVFESSVKEEGLLANCTRNCSAVFVGSTKTTLLAAIPVKLLSTASSELSGNWKIESSIILPKSCLLSSSSLDNFMSPNMGALFEAVLKRSAFYVYEDLPLAEEMLRQEKDWITTVYMRPGCLALDV